MDSKTALAELKNFQGSRKSAGDYYTQAQGELGVDPARQRQEDLRGLIRNTETQLKGVGQSVAGRTRGNLVTEAQRARLQNLESQPIAQQLADRQGEFSDAQTNYRDLLAQAGQRAGMSYQTDADRERSLQSMYDRLFGEEQAAAERAFRERQAEESRRQFEAQMEQSRRQSAANQASLASLNSLLNPVAPTAVQQTPVDVNKAFSSGGLTLVGSPGGSVNTNKAFNSGGLGTPKQKANQWWDPFNWF